MEFGVHNPLRNANLTSIQKNLNLILEKLPIPEDLGSPELLAEILTGYLDDTIRSKLDNVRIWFNNKVKSSKSRHTVIIIFHHTVAT